MLLHHLIKTKPLDMASLESYSEQELRAICRECKIDKIVKLTLSKVHPLRPLTCAYSIKLLFVNISQGISSTITSNYNQNKDHRLS